MLQECVYTFEGAEKAKEEYAARRKAINNQYAVSSVILTQVTLVNSFSGKSYGCS